jgi:hypothetical protein
MAKNNPLFVDSTLLHGDRISTQIELHKVLIYDDETLFVVLTNQLGETQRVPMKLSTELNFQARVWLGHQKSITFRFVLEKRGREALQSATYKARAQYALIEDWEPAWGDDVAKIKEDAKPLALLPNAPLPGDYASTVSSLIQKWGL